MKPFEAILLNKAVKGGGGGGGGDDKLPELLNHTITEVSYSGVSTIYQYVFRYCSQLSRANFPDVTNIEGGAFASCSNLQEVSFPNLLSAGGSAFMSCTALISVYMPKLSSIALNMFTDCNHLVTAAFPEAKGIGGSGLQNLTRLTYLSVPEVSYIGYRGIVASIITSLYFPKVTSTASYAISACYSLNTARFDIISSLGSHAFDNCSRLASLYLLGESFCSANGILLSYTPMSSSTVLGYYGSIFVRQSLVDTYKAASYWSNFSDRFVGLTDEEIVALG